MLQNEIMYKIKNLGHVIALIAIRIMHQREEHFGIGETLHVLVSTNGLLLQHLSSKTSCLRISLVNVR